MKTPILPTELSPFLATSLLGSTPLSWIPPEEVPQPYRSLLVHDHDMTSELADFHGDSISLSILQAQLTESIYRREVTLHTAANGKVVEYGLIEIFLDSVPPDIRPHILAGDTPLGTILTTSGLPFRSEPQGFFTVPAQTLESLFTSSLTGNMLYGRYNNLVADNSTIIAGILEILPT